MAKPKEVKLSKKNQKSVMSRFKKDTKDARRIAKELSLPRHDVMFFLESEGVVKYSEGSYA